MSHLIEMSNITTRANNQFPRPDFHRLDKQPYRLQPLCEGDGFRAVTRFIHSPRGIFSKQLRGLGRSRRNAPCAV
jgi:hypothetical protein